MADGLDWTRIDPQMPRAARQAVIVASALALDTGEVPGGVPHLAAVLAVDTVPIHRALTQAEKWAYLHRHIQNPRPTEVFAALARLRTEGCPWCGAPPVKPRAVDAQCRRCATLSADRLAWRGLALQIWLTSKAAGMTEAQIVYRISARTGIPVYPDAHAESSHEAQSVVAWAVSWRLIDSKWLSYARNATGKRLLRNHQELGVTPSEEAGDL